MTIILIYETIPESLMIFKFENPDERMTDILRRCHQKYANSTEDIEEDVLEFLNDPPKENLIFDNTEGLSDYSKFRWKMNDELQIIVAGFIL